MKPKLIDLKIEIDKSKIMVEKFSTQFLTVHRTTEPKTSKDIEEFNNSINQQNLINIDGTSHWTMAGYIFSSSAHWVRTKIDPI